MINFAWMQGNFYTLTSIRVYATITFINSIGHFSNAFLWNLHWAYNLPQSTGTISINFYISTFIRMWISWLCESSFDILMLRIWYNITLIKKSVLLWCILFDDKVTIEAHDVHEFQTRVRLLELIANMMSRHNWL